MGLSLRNLDDRTRALMLEEIEEDERNRTLYMSRRLSPMGFSTYPSILKKAAKQYDDSWLTRSLRDTGCLNHTEQRRKPKGGFTTVAVPVTAAETLAEGEFNRFYIRALCRRVIADGITLVVYRAKVVASPRPESLSMEGRSVDPAALLADLRASIGVDTALGLPPGPNSGMSVRLS